MVGSRPPTFLTHGFHRKSVKHMTGAPDIIRSMMLHRIGLSGKKRHDRFPDITLITHSTLQPPMKAEKQPELRWQCLNCYRTFKGEEAEQKALDCCGSLIQGWWTNYAKWGKQKWYGR